MDALPCLPLSGLDGRLACLNLSSSVLLLACAGSASYILGMLRSILMPSASYGSHRAAVAWLQVTYLVLITYLCVQ